jgi:hypothetical protein
VLTPTRMTPKTQKLTVLTTCSPAPGLKPCLGNRLLEREPGAAGMLDVAGIAWGAKTLFTSRNHPALQAKPSADAPDG